MLNTAKVEPGSKCIVFGLGGEASVTEAQMNPALTSMPTLPAVSLAGCALSCLCHARTSILRVRPASAAYRVHYQSQDSAEDQYPPPLFAMADNAVE